MDDATALPLDSETKAIERPGDHKQELRLWLRLFSCKTLIEREIRTRLRRQFDTTLPRFDLMAQLDKVPTGMKLGELSRRLMVSNGNTTALVDTLMDQGLIATEPAPDDGRAQLVRLTAEGRRQFRAMAAAHEQWIAEAFADLAPGEIASLLRLMGKAKDSARKALTG